MMQLAKHWTLASKASIAPSATARLMKRIIVIQG